MYEGIMYTILASYSSVRAKIRDGDLLLFRRRRSLVGKLIAVAGRSDYSHPGMAAWWNGRLMCLETVQFHGGDPIYTTSLLTVRAYVEATIKFLQNGQRSGRISVPLNTKLPERCFLVSLFYCLCLLM